ncbi:ATP-dependent Clp protease ATP-binding subunit [Tichowtungia aerotolerans]|uniref:AAA domain-containing protein n=1 Tax=Tichowtungia aerotolerans TaxID=2697043 RepID=A0A6P1M7A2_9BACT|nr:ATP-dependent Clp protease ATP-binding subunit [Tichowtungia aerotolerans]QHI70639.1 AAA domain-containing protein [Tichowtungia aerotolerans]
MENFTPRAQRVLHLARKEAEQFNHNYVGTEHILLGLVALGSGVAVSALQSLGIDLQGLRMEVEKAVGVGGDTKMTGNIPFTPRAKKVLALATSEARSLSHSYVGTEHILLGLLREGEGIAARVLENMGVDLDEAREEIMAMLDPDYDGSMQGGEEEAPPYGSPATGADGKELKTPALNAFGRDLTELARKNELDPVIGRHSEIERVIQILCRRTKNNPVLLGEAGVGKTAIAEGLAQSIADGTVPQILAEKKVITLDLALMVAGTKYRGQFEERIKAVMDEIKKTGNVLLFLDELHTIVGAGSAEGTMDAANIIKPALSRGELQCIGATTLNEYRKSIEKDAALERRFQTVMVNEPTIEETIQILKGLRVKYEEHHHAKITDEALEAATKLAARYLPDRFLPDKAIDLIDEAGARGHIANMVKPPEFQEIRTRLKEAQEQKDIAIREQKFEDAAAHRDAERKAKEELEAAKKAWETEQQENISVVEEEDIRVVVSKWTGVPVDKMGEQALAKLLKMEEQIEKIVIGQNEAVSAISRALRRSRAELKDPKRPIGSFAFLGPTGVGKTMLAKELARFMFDDPDALIQIDMSEYMEKFSASRLVGSPPGYVGHEEGGQLTERVRRRPYSVVLFDEIEKAHPDVMHMMLQILEEGRLTDSLGRSVDFRNTIVIMTSNVGATHVAKGGLGFAPESEEDDYDKLKKVMMTACKDTFKPELVNRLDDIIVFRQLTVKDIEVILDLEVSRVQERVEARKIKLTIAPKAKEFLIQKGFDKAYGARQLRRAVERHLEDPMAEAILRGELESGKPVSVRAGKDKLTFVQ